MFKSEFLQFVCTGIRRVLFSLPSSRAVNSPMCRDWSLTVGRGFIPRPPCRGCIRRRPVRRDLIPIRSRRLTRGPVPGIPSRIGTDLQWEWVRDEIREDLLFHNPLTLVFSLGCPKPLSFTSLFLRSLYDHTSLYLDNTHSFPRVWSSFGNGVLYNMFVVLKLGLVFEVLRVHTRVLYP